MRLAVVIIVNGESPEIVTARRERDDVAILFPEGEREIPDSLLGDEMETERLGYDGGASAGVKPIGKPCSVETVRGTFGTSTVDEERSICKTEGGFSSTSSSDLDGERERRTEW